MRQFYADFENHLQQDITDRKQAETNLILSESRLQDALNYAHVAYWELSQDGKTAIWSKQIYQLLGLPPDFQPNPEKLCEIINASDSPNVIQSLQHSLATNKEHHIEYKINRLNDKAERWIECRGKPVIGADGVTEKLSGFIQDITERKQAEEALRKSRSQLEVFVKQAPVSIAMFDHNMNYLAISDRWFMEFGRGYKNLIGHNHYEIYPDISIDWKLAYQQGLSGVYLKNEDDLWIEEDGRKYNLRWAISPWFDENGSIGGIIIATENITERKYTELQLRIAATVFESQEGMLVSDANGTILRVNRAFTNITGYSADEVIGQNPRLLSSGRHDADFYNAMWESINNTGVWEGEIWNRRKTGEVYPEHLTITAVKDQDGIVINYVATLADITLNKEAAAEIETLAFYDPLTSLPNRRLLMDRLYQALASSARSGKNGALLFLDLDNFKTLNDTLGHDIGDLLLQQVAERLINCVRKGDTVVRLGGDEFVVMLEDLSEQIHDAAAQTKIIGEKLLTTLNQPYLLGKHEYTNSSSIGVVLFSNQEKTREELLRYADIAMYQAKNSGGNTLRFFDPQMQTKISERAELERELRKAIDAQQFHLHYQIQVDNYNHPLGAEALIHWVHPERGMISPMHFISIAEETGLILPIGQWVLESACTQIKIWQKSVSTRDLILSVNVSAKQFHQNDFVAQVRTIIQSHGINPSLLKLELTESILLDNIEGTIATMNALQAIGIRFSLDDFGTGYSSLQYLKRLPLNQLKIDQSFVRDIALDSNDRAIVRTIIAMAKSLDLDIIAEGVETEEQQQFLQKNGCTHYQGYLFSKPVPIEQFEELIRTTEYDNRR